MKIAVRTEETCTPLERKQAFDRGEELDRVITVPFMGEFKCSLAGISVWDFWHDARKMADAEIVSFNTFGHDRLWLGPNTRGISEALGAVFIYPEEGVPYAGTPFLKDYRQLEEMEPIDAKKNSRIQTFAQAAEILAEEAAHVVPVEMSIGGPFTIASTLRGVEYLLRDCRKCPDEIHRLMRIITESQKSCIDVASMYQMGIAMADPVANPALIGPKMYEKFVYPYTKELTDYACKKTGKKVSLHMCGKTNSIWNYLKTYTLNELSLDNIIDLQQAVTELGDHITIAGNVDPVEIILNGTKEQIFEEVRRCVSIGKKAKKGYVLATGCDVPNTVRPEQIQYMMDAARRIEM